MVRRLWEPVLEPLLPEVGRRTRWPCAAGCGDREGSSRPAECGGGEGAAARKGILSRFSCSCAAPPKPRVSRTWPGPLRQLDALLGEKASVPAGQGLQGEQPQSLPGAPGRAHVECRRRACRVFGGGRADLGPGGLDKRRVTGSGQGGDTLSVRRSTGRCRCTVVGRALRGRRLSRFPKAFLGPAAALDQGQLAKLFPDPRATRAACHVHS